MTRTIDYHRGEKEIVVSLWWIQKPAWDSKGKFWWCDCRGKQECISKKLAKQLFGVIPKEHEIYTIEDNKITKRQTKKECNCGDAELRFGLEW